MGKICTTTYYSYFQSRMEAESGSLANLEETVLILTRVMFYCVSNPLCRIRRKVPRLR
jgi:hypothetical protein